MAGSEPAPICRGLPPVTGIDSTVSVQPCLTAKYTVVRSAETEISSPMTPPGTSVLTTEPVTEFSTTSAPALVTATTAGGLAARCRGHADAVEAGRESAPAEAAAPLPGALLPPPQEVSRTATAGTVSIASTVRRGTS